jgi:5'-3' exonuclease
MTIHIKATTLLIDGNFLIKRSYNGAKHVYNNNRHIGGLYQFLIQLRSLIRKFNINKVVVFWDGENSGKLRYDLYERYKANRESKEWYTPIMLTTSEIYKQEQEKESFLWQLTRVKQYLEELFIRQIEVDKIESDDLISYYCKKYHEDENIIIYSNDRDLCQLLEYSNVSIFIANKKQLINKNTYYLLFNHHVSNLTVIKTICGDSSDNISGIEGVGETTLLKYFPDIKIKPVKANDIIKQSKIINEQRILNKKKPIKALDNIVNGIFKDLGELGLEGYKTNYKIINLLEPLLTREAMAELVLQSEQPLDIENRGEKNLLNMIVEDGVLNEYGSDFIRFHEPFYPVILREKELYKK